MSLSILPSTQVRYRAVVGIVLVVLTTALGQEPNDVDQSVLQQRLRKNISVQFRNTPIEDVIRILAEQADVDIVKSPNVQGQVTVTLTDVPLEEALQNILAAHGCTYILTDNMIRVITLSEKIQAPELVQSKLFEITYADVSQVVKALEKYISKQGAVSYIEGTSHILVTDTESKLWEITHFIERIDRMTPQVLVEARIYDITVKDRLDLGIEWQAGRNTTYSSTTGITGVGTNPTAGRDDPFFTTIFGGASTKAENATGAIRLGWLNSGIDIDTLLRAQQERINAKLLANPRILVLNNETASIKIVSEIPYQELQESAMGGSIGTTAFREVGVELQVTPHLAERDQMIRLHIQPKFSVQTGEVQVAGVGVTYPQPVVDRREADTRLLVRSGQTVVLGGLRKKDVTQQINKIPVLGDMPLLGPLFRFTGEETVTSELVVFITPWIVEQPAMTADEKAALEQTSFPPPQPGHTQAEIKARQQHSFQQTGD